MILVVGECCIVVVVGKLEGKVGWVACAGCIGPGIGIAGIGLRMVGRWVALRRVECWVKGLWSMVGSRTGWLVVGHKEHDLPSDCKGWVAGCKDQGTDRLPGAKWELECHCIRHRLYAEFSRIGSKRGRNLP